MNKKESSRTFSFRVNCFQNGNNRISSILSIQKHVNYFNHFLIVFFDLTENQRVNRTFKL